MSPLDALFRRMVPTVPTLSHRRLIMGPLDLLDRVISIPFGVGRTLPPNRMRIRVGAGNRLLFNPMLHQSVPVGFWISAFATGLARLDSRILDIGSGCGRYASTLRDFEYYGTRFTGHYTGIDVDREMVEWCRAHFPDDRFTFELAGAYSRVYNRRRRPGEAATIRHRRREPGFRILQLAAYAPARARAGRTSGRDVPRARAGGDRAHDGFLHGSSRRGARRSMEIPPPRGRGARGERAVPRARRGLLAQDAPKGVPGRGVREHRRDRRARAEPRGRGKGSRP